MKCVRDLEVEPAILWQCLLGDDTMSVGGTEDLRILPFYIVFNSISNLLYSVFWIVQMDNGAIL